MHNLNIKHVWLRPSSTKAITSGLSRVESMAEKHHLNFPLLTNIASVTKYDTIY